MEAICVFIKSKLSNEKYCFHLTFSGVLWFQITSQISISEITTLYIFRIFKVSFSVNEILPFLQSFALLSQTTVREMKLYKNQTKQNCLLLILANNSRTKRHFFNPDLITDLIYDHCYTGGYKELCSARCYRSV